MKGAVITYSVELHFYLQAGGEDFWIAVIAYEKRSNTSKWAESPLIVNVPKGRSSWHVTVLWPGILSRKLWDDEILLFLSAYDK